MIYIVTNMFSFHVNARIQSYVSILLGRPPYVIVTHLLMAANVTDNALFGQGNVRHCKRQLLGLNCKTNRLFCGKNKDAGYLSKMGRPV